MIFDAAEASQGQNTNQNDLHIGTIMGALTKNNGKVVGMVLGILKI